MILHHCEIGPNNYDTIRLHRPLSRRLDRVIQNAARYPFGGNVYYVTMQITFKFRNGQRNLHCGVVHITTRLVFCLTLDCNGVFALKAYIRPTPWRQTCAMVKKWVMTSNVLHNERGSAISDCLVETVESIGSSSSNERGSLLVYIYNNIDLN